MSHQNDTYRKPDLRLVTNNDDKWKESTTSDTTGGEIGGSGGGNGGGNDMDKIIALLELKISHTDANINEIKNNLKTIDDRILTVNSDLNKDVKWLIASGMAALFAAYVLINNSIDKNISSLDQKISSQYSSVSDQIKDLKITNNNGTVTNIASPDKK
ncbi:hypothetical protein [Nitrosomonas sp.]|uniref:hypothetical protein n=1 Tax=Nitrosomonas sp. TaxID=42353 RepID=UPI00374C91F4